MICKCITRFEIDGTLIYPILKSENLAESLLPKSKSIGLSAEFLSNEFKAEKKEVFQVATPRKAYDKVVFLGLGEKPNSHTFIEVLRHYFFSNKEKIKGNVTIDLRGLANYTTAIANGIALAQYQLGMLKTDKRLKDLFFPIDAIIHFWVSANQLEKVEKDLAKGLATAESQMAVMQLVDRPSNYKTPQMMADHVLESGKNNGFQVKVFDENQCEEMGFHALLAVGRGSVDRPARMVVMEYSGENPPKHYGLVGKGVTFDTGGISLKPGDGMEDMKMDMGGSAAVIGAIELAAKLRLNVKITGIVAFTENCIDALAIKPGDVINTYAGKTIEVINTDAEGRLILADALSYMVKEYQPDVMIDLATLTGSCIRSLGYVAAGMMTNNDKLASALEKAGNTTGEKVWRLPLWDEYRPELDSDVADIKNLGSNYAGATTAAKFLEYFTVNHANWAHLDIAGMAYMKSPYAKGASATAYGVRLLVELMSA